MGYRSDEVKVGFILVLSILILLGFILAILGLYVGRPMIHYTTSLKYIAGVDAGRPVRYGGLQVGRVADVHVDKANTSLIQIDMEIQKGTPIKTDSEAFLNFIGFVGDYYIEISTGSPDAPFLPPGSQIKPREVADFTALMASAQNAIEKINASLGLINGQVLGEAVPEFKKRLETTVNNLDKLLTDLDSVILENRDDFNQAINQISSLLQENRAGVAAIVANFREASDRLNSLADSLNSIVADNRDELNNVIKSLRDAANEAESAAEKINGIVSQNADNVTNTLENLESSSENFRDLSEELSAQPWRLLWRSKQPEKETIRR